MRLLPVNSGEDNIVPSIKVGLIENLLPINYKLICQIMYVYVAAQIGGLLGLALGFSLISGAEMVFYLLLRCCCTSRRAHSVQHQEVVAGRLNRLMRCLCRKNTVRAVPEP